MQNPQLILFTGGGSGGHIIPNLAIISALRTLSPASQFLYVGSKNPIDERLVREAQIPFKSIYTGKIRRYFDWRNFTDPFLMLFGFFQSLVIVARAKPSAVFTKGGFVSFPVVLAAWILRVPIVLHESDSVMGLSNRLTAKMARHVCVSFPSVMPGSTKVVFTGNPVRPELKEGSAEKGFALTGFRPEKPVVLIWGGSQGAQEINRLVLEHFPDLRGQFQIVHVTGEGKSIDLQDPAYKQFEYLREDLKDIYAITSIVVGRGGANSLYELAMMEKPNLVLPLRSAANNHQLINSEYFERHGACFVIREPSQFASMIKALFKNPNEISRMKESLQKLSTPHAAARIATLLLSL